MEDDRGERHNCCVSLLLSRDRSTIVVFLTDDLKAIRDYASPVFGLFPLGAIWTSHDLVLHLFMRHRRRIPAEAAQAAIRDLVSQAARPGEIENRLWQQRLTHAFRRLQRADQVLVSLT
jgi:hypothetical protein